MLWALGWNLLWARIVLDLYGDRRLAFWSLAARNPTRPKPNLANDWVPHLLGKSVALFEVLGLKKCSRWR